MKIATRAVNYGKGKDVVLSKPVPCRSCHPARAGWAEAARAPAGHGSDELVMDEFGNTGDAKLRWQVTPNAKR
jgi:hypothetical protein